MKLRLNDNEMIKHPAIWGVAVGLLCSVLVWGESWSIETQAEWEQSIGSHIHYCRFKNNPFHARFSSKFRKYTVLHESEHLQTSLFHRP